MYDMNDMTCLNLSFIYCLLFDWMSIANGEYNFPEIQFLPC